MKIEMTVLVTRRGDYNGHGSGHDGPGVTVRNFMDDAMLYAPYKDVPTDELRLIKIVADVSIEDLFPPDVVIQGRLSEVCDGNDCDTL